MRMNSEYRAEAREKLAGNWQEVIVFIVIYLAIVLVCNCLNVGQTLWSDDNGSLSAIGGNLLNLLIAAPMGYVVSMLFLDFVRGINKLSFENLWNHFRDDYARLLCTSFVATVIAAVTSIFTLGIAGIYFGLAYAMVPFLMHDYPELTWRELLQTSREMMDGHKWDLLCLQLSFIGWILVAIITCGVGLLYVIPYMEAAEALFYEDLKRESIVEESEIEEAQVVE